MPASSRLQLLTRFRARHSLRLHMFLILLATAASGALASKLLLMSGVDGFAIRYSIAMLLSYAMFFGCIKLWLLAIAPSGSGASSFVDAIDIPVGGSGSSSCGGSTAPFSGGGGSFAGGGASADFDGGATPLAAAAISDATDGVGSVAGDAVSDAAGGAVGEAAGEVLGGAGDALGDEGGLGLIIVALVLVVVVAAVLGASVYVIYEAPVILSEAAFQGVLAATLTRRTREMAKGEWVGSVLRATWKPFIITLGFTIICGLLLQGFFPEASRLADIWR